MAALNRIRPLLVNFCKFTRLSLSNTVSGVRTFAASSCVRNSGPSSGGGSPPTTADVPGLSTKVVSVPNGEVGPGASKNAPYKNPEYFCYNNTSYFEAEVEMLKYRCPQPSNKTPLTKP